MPNVKFKDNVEKVLNDIRPSLEADGGGVDLVLAENGVVTVHLTGACNGCPMAAMTLQFGVEKMLVEKVKGFKELKAV